MHANVFALLIQHGSKMTLSTVAPLYEHKTPKHKKRPCSLYGWLTRLILRQNKKQGNKEKTTTTKHTSQQRLLFINSLRNISQRKWKFTLMSFQTHMTYFLLLNTQRYFGECAGRTFPCKLQWTATKAIKLQKRYKRNSNSWSPIHD